MWESAVDIGVGEDMHLPVAFYPQIGNAETEVKLETLMGFLSLETKCDKINIERGTEMRMNRECREILREQAHFSYLEMQIHRRKYRRKEQTCYSEVLVQ